MREGDQRNQLGPGNHHVHFVQELALARPLGLAFESALAQAHLFHDFNVALPVPAGRFCRLSLGQICGYYCRNPPKVLWVGDINIEQLQTITLYLQRSFSFREQNIQIAWPSP